MTNDPEREPIDEDRMLSMVATLALGTTLAEARRSGKVSGPAEEAMWAELKSES